MHICNKFLLAIKQTDQFGEMFQMRLRENDSVYRSYMGALCSFVIFVFLMTFTVTKLQTLILVSDVDIF